MEPFDLFTVRGEPRPGVNFDRTPALIIEDDVEDYRKGQDLNEQARINVLAEKANEGKALSRYRHLPSRQFTIHPPSSTLVNGPRVINKGIGFLR